MSPWDRGGERPAGRPAVAQLKHLHISEVHDIVEDGELPYIVMELVEGGSLADRLSRTGPVGDDGTPVPPIGRAAAPDTRGHP